MNNTKKEIMDWNERQIIERLKELQGFEIYSSAFVASDKCTSKGTVIIKDTNNSLIEIVAKYVYDNKIDFGYKSQKGKEIREGKEFRFINHKGYSTEKSSYQEKIICRNWFNNGFYIENKKYGEVVDYESNIIKNTNTNIDIVSYNKESQSLYLIEVKGNGKVENGKLKIDSQESLLRCILEIETYYETLKNNGLLEVEGFIDNIKSGVERIDFEKDRNSLKEDNVKLLILVPKESFAHRMYLEKKEYPYVHKLLNEKYTNIKVDFFENVQDIFDKKLNK